MTRVRYESSWDNDQRYCEQAAKSFSVTFSGTAGERIAVGVCPRCGHPTNSKIVPDSATPGGIHAADDRVATDGIDRLVSRNDSSSFVTRTATTDAEPNHETETVRCYCACGKEHKGRPSGAEMGCGAHWRLRLQGPPPGHVVPWDPPADLDELRRTELDRVRQRALGWRNGLAGALMMVTGFGLLRGRSDISTLPRDWGVVVGLMLLGCLVAGLLSAVHFLRAAHGALTARPSYEMPTVHEEAAQTLRAVQRGGVLAAIAAVLLVAAVGTTWYAPETTAPSTKLLITGMGQMCGTVLAINDGYLTLELSGAARGSDGARSRVELPVADVLAITAVASC